MLTCMTDLERFNAVMNDGGHDRVPNWEAGAWAQAISRWESEGLSHGTLGTNWFPGQDMLGLDQRLFIGFDKSKKPGFESKVIDEDEQTQLIQDTNGCIRRTLKAGKQAGMSMCMDTYLRHAVDSPETWTDVKRRLDAFDRSRLPVNWMDRLPAWENRTCPLIFGTNTSTEGFFWFARTLMGTENLSYAWYDQPELMHEMMAFQADFLIESARPVLEKIAVDYVCLAEDLAMKTGPLISPDCYRTFILPLLKRVIAFYRSCGVKHICIDSDGNFELLLPMMMDVGVDAIWPIERAAGMDPIALRKKFGNTLRLWGGVDKRELTGSDQQIKAHLQSLRPLIDDGRFIPTVDHMVPPDVSYHQFQMYMQYKSQLLDGKL